MEFDYTQWVGLGGVPVIAAMIKMFKSLRPETNEKWWPVVAWILGILINVVLGFALHSNLGMALAIGFLTGMTASGFYSQTKTYLGG